MQPGFHVLYCICNLRINGIAHYYVSGEETSINLNIFVNWSIDFMLYIVESNCKKVCTSAVRMGYAVSSAHCLDKDTSLPDMASFPQAVEEGDDVTQAHCL